MKTDTTLLRLEDHEENKNSSFHVGLIVKKCIDYIYLPQLSMSLLFLF